MKLTILTDSVLEWGSKMDQMLNNGYKEGDTFGAARETISELGNGAITVCALTAGIILEIFLSIKAIKYMNDSSRDAARTKSGIIRVLLAIAGVTLAVVILLIVVALSDIIKSSGG